MNGDVDSYNVDEICRLCLKGEGTILPIFGLEHSSRDCIPLSNKIKACVAVEIDRNDELPKKICVGCVHQVDSWHKFKTACDTAQTKLSSWIKTTERYKSTTSEIIIKQEPIDEVEDDDVIICCDDDSNDNDAVYSLPQSPTFEDISSAPEPVSAEFMVEDHHHHHHKDGTHLDDNSRSNKSAENDEHHHQNSGNVSNSIHENNVEMGSPRKERSMLENALEGGVETNEKSYLNEDEIMMADFSDEIAPDVNLLKDVEVDVHQDNIDSDNEIDGLVDENSATSTGVVNTEGSTLISKIHIEMNRRISADYDIEPDDFDDFDYEDGPVEESNLDVPMEQSQSNEVGVVERVRVTRSSKRVGDESADVTKSESGMLIEAFTLAGKRSFDADPFNEEHEKLLNGAVGSSSNVDPDTLTVHSSISQSDATSMIVKQEPLSPGVDNEYGPSITKDWSTESTAAVDVKPNVEELNKKRQKRKYRKRIKLGSIPCEPCGYTYPNYVKFIRHCKSQKHRNNVRIYEKLGKTVPKQPSPEPVTPPKLNSTHSPTSVDVSNGTGSNMCPIMSCSKSFKYRRNLQSHVKHNHGFNLKDFERSEPIDETYIPPEPPAETEPQESPPIDGRKSTTFSCNMCSKEFGYRRSLKHHLFIFHNVTPPTPRLKCPKCMKNFQRMTGLKSHLRSCGVFLNSKRCPYCQEDFPTYKDNYRHKSVCPKKYASKEKSLQAVKKIFSAPENSRYRCRFCDIMFEARSIYSDHMEMYHPGESIDVVEEPPVPELITQKDLTSSEDVKDNNVMIKVNNGEVPCKFCFKTFPSISELNIHVEEHQYSKSFECKLCKSVLTTMRNFHDHMRSHFVTHRKQYLCWTCYTPFNNRSELGAHKKLHENITMRIYTCNVCKHSFHDEASFQHHKQTHFYGFESEASEHVNSKRTLLKTIKNDERETDEAKVASLLCQICKKEFSNQTALDKHSRLHKPVNSEVIKKLVQHCSTCNKTFKSRFELRNHQPYCKQTNQDGEAQMNVSMPSYKKSIYNKTAHPHQRVHCDKCGGSFAKAIGLKKHITMNRCPLVRQDVDKVKKTYSCRYCRKVLATIAGLYKHLNGCKKFISKYGKNYHSNQCPTCHKQFSSLGVLYNHARFCSGSSTAISKLIKQEPGVYKSCDNCQAKFDTDELFDEHKKACKTSVNRDSNQFEKNCAYCNLRFDNVTNYKLHKKYCSKGESSSSSPTGSFRCEGCSRVCFSQDRLKSHLKTCKFYRQTPVVMLTKQTVIEQCKCGVVFTSRSALDAHRVNCAVVKDTINDSKENSNSTPVNPKNLECQYCHRKFEKYYSRNSHLRICKAKHRHLYGKRGPSANQQQKQSKPTPSTTSPSLTSTPKPQTNHLPPPPPMIPLSSLSSSMTSSSTSFMCSMCNSLFPTESDLMLHNCHQQHPPPTNSNDAVEIMVEPDNPLNFNDYSDFGFHYMDDISQREQNSLREQNLLKCLPCDKVFSSSVTLNKHRNLFHPNEATDMYLVKGDGTVQCPKCPRSFKDQKSMAHHMGWHTRLEDSSGQQQQQQQQQVSNSTNMFMPTPPPVASSSSSSSSPSVPPYVEQKTPFPCTYCHRRFSGKGQLQNHLKTHTQQLPYPSSSSSNNSMDGDSQNPATTLTYRCRFCSKRFRDKSVMLEHQNLHKTILAASSTTTTTATPKPKPAVEPVPKYLVSCNMCHKILSSNSVAKHKKMHEMKENIRLHIPSLFTAINKPVQTKPNEVQYQQTKHDEIQYQQQQQQYLQQQQQYQQQIQPPQSMMVPCPICYRLFSGQRSLTDHMSTEHAGYSKIDVVEIDDDEDDYQSNNVNQSHLMDAGNVAYKCEICNLSWQHKSEYLQHVNDPSHRELTNRLSAILNRVNNDISIS